MEPEDISESGDRRIHDMPHGDRPREKLAQLGPAALDNAELMALFISTGTKGRSAIQMGRDLLRRYGSLGALGSLPVSQLAKEHGMGIAKASKLAAAFELGCRVAREQVNLRPLDSPELIYEYFGPQLGHLAQEQVMVAVLDSRLRHMGTQTISMGTVNESPAHPREILRPVITRGAHAFVLVHNHPSGDPTPSRSDESITRRLIDAAALMQVKFMDHVIVGRPSPGRQAYFSFREAGIVQ
ncbi:MAG TPA: DNA repair protein RadC [Luteolibacter sp.]|nr:DNA repair protein RadC [Luteolibacter sp.]